MTINTQCAVQIRHPMTARPIYNPRSAVLWDQVAAPPRETLGYALTIRANYAGFPITLAASPDADVIQTVDGVRVAAAHPIVYGDNGDGRYTPAAPPFFPAQDSLRGVSLIAIIWIDPATTVPLARTRFADLQPGYQYVHVHAGYSRGTVGFSPFDLTRAVCADVVAEDFERFEAFSPLPNLLR